MGTNENSKDILISHDMTYEERKKLREKKKKEKIKMKNKREWIGPENLKRVNKTEKWHESYHVM